METHFDEDVQDTDFAVFEPEPSEPGAVAREQEHSKQDLTLKMLRQVHESVGHVIEMLESGTEEGLANLANLVTNKKQIVKKMEEATGTRVVEGMFDGQAMIGPDGKSYSVPPNYASKSRLVEGDVLKLTIRQDGTFIYKQISPIERKRVVGCLSFDTASGGFLVVCGNVPYKVLTASVTYFKGEPGDEVVAFVPKSGPSGWAAVENIIRK